MANIQRKQFTFYDSFYQAAKKISKAVDREKFLMAIIEYALFGKETEKLPESCCAAFSIVKPVLESSRRKAESGSKGGSAESKQTEANGKQNEANRKQEQANRKQEKEQVKEQEQEKEQVKEQLEQTGSTDQLRQLWNAYPGNRRDSFGDVAKAAAEMNLTGKDIATAASNLLLWKKSMEWTRDNGQYIPGMVKWLESGKWVSPPPAAQLTSNPFLAMAIEEGCYDQG